MNKCFLLFGFGLLTSQLLGEPDVTVLPVPEGGIQPVAQTDAEGNIHLVYFRGEAAHGDLFYTARHSMNAAFETPVKVNSIPASAVAMGTIRGAQLALGQKDHIHIAWMGSSKAAPKDDHYHTPMLYTRSTNGGESFEPERDLITTAFGLDGGGAVAANAKGQVQVYWHAGEPKDGEAGRRVWVTRSDDSGQTFAPEVPVWEEKTGVCACCGMSAGASENNFWVIYRSATEQVNRDIYLLHSNTKEPQFTGRRIDSLRAEVCPMSSMSLSFSDTLTAASWETKNGSVAFSLGGGIIRHLPPGELVRKFPSVAVAPDGGVLLTWIEGGGWQKEGRLAWQLFNAEGEPIDVLKIGGTTAAWTKPAAVHAGDRFVIIH